MTVSSIRSETEYERFKSRKPIVVVEFYAEWSKLSKGFDPTYEAISNDKQNLDVAFGRADADQLSDLLTNEGETILPTFIVFVRGGEFAKIVGPNETELKAKIREARAKLAI
ncbi:thioredoxin domain-containing protein [Nocardia sp. NPDC051321]|uniref:thioredoxin domain-containing protein n=1 Tax=Nocardia sp. NPDC051321 TaxID=3364323 RepID=UPI0037AA8FBA